jgi:hypothetical protein
MIEVGAIGENYIGKGSLVLVETIRVDGDFSSKGEIRRSSFDRSLRDGSTLRVTHRAADTPIGVDQSFEGDEQPGGECTTLYASVWQGARLLDSAHPPAKLNGESTNLYAAGSCKGNLGGHFGRRTRLPSRVNLSPPGVVPSREGRIHVLAIRWVKRTCVDPSQTL